MAISIQRRELAQEELIVPPGQPARTGFAAAGWEYHVAFNPDFDDHEVRSLIGIELVFSLTETGEVADLSFEIPKICRNQHSLYWVHREESAGIVDKRVFIAVPGMNGDAVLKA